MGRPLPSDTSLPSPSPRLGSTPHDVHGDPSPALLFRGTPPDPRSVRTLEPSRGRSTSGSRKGAEAPTRPSERRPGKGLTAQRGRARSGKLGPSPAPPVEAGTGRPPHGRGGAKTGAPARGRALRRLRARRRGPCPQARLGPPSEGLASDPGRVGRGRRYRPWDLDLFPTCHLLDEAPT